MLVVSQKQDRTFSFNSVFTGNGSWSIKSTLKRFADFVTYVAGSFLLRDRDAVGW